MPSEWCRPNKHSWSCAVCPTRPPKPFSTCCRDGNHAKSAATCGGWDNCSFPISTPQNKSSLKSPFVSHNRRPRLRHESGSRYHGSLKKECIGTKAPRDRDDATHKIACWVEHDNGTRLHRGIGYLTPTDCLSGLSAEIHALRDRKLEEARARRKQTSQQSLAMAG